MGPDCGIDNLDAITKSNHLCNELGMDPHFAGRDGRLRHGPV